MAKSVSKPHRTTPPVRISFPQVFQPRAVRPEDTPRYGVVCMFDKKDKEHMAFLKELLADMKAVATEKWPKEPARAGNAALVGGTYSPVKDGDKTVNKQGVLISEKNPEYAGHYVVRAGSLTKPVVVDRNVATIMDTNEIYGGCRCKVNLNVYAHQNQGGGVTCGLNGVQKWADDESFGGGRPPTEDMFGAGGGGSEDPSNYDPLGGDTTERPPLPADDDIPF